MVKIETTTTAQKATLRRLAKTGTTGGATFTPSAEAIFASEETAQVTGPFPASSLFVLQEISEKDSAKHHGTKILGILDQVRSCLLTGELENQHLLNLKNYLEQQHNTYTDPQLKAIVEEIEQRANIELAKRGLI